MSPEHFIKKNTYPAGAKTGDTAAVTTPPSLGPTATAPPKIKITTNY